MTTPKHHRALLEQVYGGRPWLLGGDTLVGLGPMASWLKGLGATKALCVAGSRGTGNPPDPEFAPDPILLGVTGRDLVEVIRHALDALADVPDEVQARVDAFDPDGTCRAIAPFYGDGRAVAGRRVFGARRASWRALEDKTRIDALWDDLGVPRANSRIVPPKEASLLAAMAEMEQGGGTAWVADDRDGVHGGGAFLRLVRTRAQAKEAVKFFAGVCDAVRVMPWLEGIPCSIHGIVFRDDVVALRPCEMLMLQRPGTMRLHYAGAATFWDPQDEDREEMRALARRVGAALRERYGYRGVFTIDGIMTTEGFRPTELNPRFGGAIGQLGARIPELPLLLLHYAVIEHDELDWRPRELERLVLEMGDRYRGATAVALVDKTFESSLSRGLVFDDDGTARFLTAEEQDAGRPPAATAACGPGPTGGFVRVLFVPDHTPVGPALGPRAAAALSLLDDAWSLGIGPLAAATDVKPRT
jgi:hypothetical protein